MKNQQINVRLNEQHFKTLQQIVQQGKAKTQSAALVYLIDQYAILGSK